MNFGKVLGISKPSDLEYSRIKRLLDEMMSQGVEILQGIPKAIVCNDCVVIVQVEEKGFTVQIIPTYSTLSFDLNLTPEEIKNFNGGDGSVRYFKFHKETQEKYKDTGGGSNG